MGHNKNKNKNKHHVEISQSDIDDFLAAIENISEEEIKVHKRADKGSAKDQKANKIKSIFKEIDLHGFNVLDAEKYLVEYVYSFWQQNSDAECLHLRVITGKGRHSSMGKGKLITEIYHFVKSNYKTKILAIDEPPAELKINDLPIKGHFEVKLSR